jgi:hypothetical protein
VTGQAGTVLRWPLWSWRNLSASAVVVLLALFGIGRAIEPAGPTSPEDGVAVATSQPTVPAPVPDEPSSAGSSLSPTTAPGTTLTASGAPQPAAGDSVTMLATAFATAWSSAGRSQAEWNAGIRPFVTAALATGLARTDPANVPATKVTGEAVLLTAAATSAQVRVPTDGGSIVVTLQRGAAGPWLISDVAPADQPPGAPTPDLHARTSPARS